MKRLLKNPLLFLALFALGAALLFLWEYTLTILLGVALQLAAVVLGVFTIAEPGFLSGDDEASAASASGDSEKSP